MISRKLPRIALAAALFSTIPYAAVNAVTADEQHLANLKAKGHVEITRRLANFVEAGDTINTGKVPPLELKKLNDAMNAEEETLNSLDTQLAADTTLAQARAHVAAIGDDYRTYSLLMPVLHLAAMSDHVTTGAAELETVIAAIQRRVDTAKAAGKNVDVPKSRIQDMKSKMDKAKRITNGQIAQLVAEKPSDPDTNMKLLRAYRADMLTARAALLSARNDITAALTALNSLDK